MKNFEKWFEETYPLPRTMERGPIGRDMKVACKAAYREALEWIEHIVVYESDGPSNPKSLIQCIEEELEDETTK